jgi:hypothetical protein
MKKIIPRQDYFSATYIFFLFVLILSLSPLLAMGETASIEYNIKGRLNQERHVIDGKEVIEFTNPLDEATDEVVLKLKANLQKEPNPYLSEVNLDGSYPGGFDPGWTKIESINGADGNGLNYEMESLPPTNQTYSLENTAVRVQLSQPLQPGEKTSITVKFSTKFPVKSVGDEEFYRDVYSWRFGWNPTLAPAEWWKGYNRQVYSQIVMQEADYEVELNVPDDFVVGGNVVSRSGKGNAGNRKSIKLKLPSARSFPLTMSQDYQNYRETFENYSIRVLHRPGYEEEARLLASYGNEILNYYSEKFGSYGRKQLTFAQSPRSGYFGMAADGLIVLGDSFFAEKDLALSTIANRQSEYLIAHEVAHQWFGIGVGADLHSQNWISEAFSEFLALSYFHHKYSAEGPNLYKFERNGLLRNSIESQLGFTNLRKHTFELPYIANFQKGFDEAVVKPRQDVKYANATRTRIYKKGYLILRTLEGAIGEGEMNDFVRTIYRRYGNSVTDVAELAREARKITGDKVPDNFFQEWLTSSGYVNYGISNLETEKKSDDSYLSKVTLTKSGSLVAPVELRVTFSSGKTVKKTLKLESESKIVEFEKPTSATKATVDPNSEVMDTNRLNNHYPRKVEVSFGKNRLPLDAYFIMIGPGTITGRTPNRYAWSIGPGVVQGRLNLGRNLSLSGGATLTGQKITDLDLNGWVGADIDLWSSPKIGRAGKYMIQDRSLKLRFERVTGKDDSTYNLFGIGGSLSQKVTANRQLDFQSTLSLGGSAKFSVSGRETERLFPGTYLNFSTNIGFSPGELPSLLKFDLPELKSYGRVPEGGSGIADWKRYQYPGNYKLFSRVSFGFPVASNERYYLGSLALVTDIRQSFFLSAGDTWDKLNEIGIKNFKYEGGTEVSISGKTLGGLIPFDLAVGYAYHGQDKGRPYLNFSLGF